MFGQAEGDCMTCRYRFDCPERDRGIACASYKGDKNEVPKRMEWDDGDHLGRGNGRQHSEKAGTGESDPDGKY